MFGRFSPEIFFEKVEKVSVVFGGSLRFRSSKRTERALRRRRGRALEGAVGGSLRWFTQDPQSSIVSMLGPLLGYSGPGLVIPSIQGNQSMLGQRCKSVVLAVVFGLVFPPEVRKQSAYRR